MKDTGKTREQLIAELEALHQQIAKLEKSRDRYRSRIDGIHESYFELDLDGNFTFINDATCQNLGYSRKDLLGMNYTAVVIREDRQAVGKAFKHILRTGEPGVGISRQILTKDESLRFAEVSISPLRNQEGKIIGFRGTGRDATLQKKAEEALRKSEQKYQSLVQDTSVGIAAVDLTGTLTFVNRALSQMLGYSETELIGRPFANFLDPNGKEEILETFLGAPTDPRQNVDLEFRALGKGKEALDLSASVTRLRRDEEPIGFNAIIVDISQRKRLEGEKQELEQRAHAASRLATVGEMAAGVAHEINNPLVGVIGYAQLLMQQDIPDELKEYAQAIYDGGQRVADIVKKLLVFARQQKPQRRYVNMNELIENTLALRTYQLESNNIKVTTKLAKDLPRTVADGGQLQQVFLNIIMNAEAAMQSANGGGNLSIKTQPIDSSICVSFKNNGPSIPKEYLDRIFDPFFTTKEVGEGTGLGLSIAHGIVTEHGGKIFAKSPPGKGVTFYVELPVVTEYEQLPLAESAVEEPKAVAGVRILVVDDEPIVRELLSRLLTDEGHHVDTLDNAADALKTIKDGRYSLILLDIKMPGMSGIELYRRLQKMAGSLEQRVVFVTGDVRGTETMKFISRTKAPYITKPFDIPKLKKELNRLLAEIPSL